MMAFGTIEALEYELMKLISTVCPGKNCTKIFLQLTNTGNNDGADYINHMQHYIKVYRSYVEALEWWNENHLYKPMHTVNYFGDEIHYTKLPVHCIAFIYGNENNYF